jgi:ribosomal protein S18 acetylase RimI-like enzyme
MYVAPEVRRRGVGRRLVEQVMREARGRFGELHLRTADAGAAAFYERVGFERVEGERFVTHRREVGRSGKNERGKGETARWTRLRATALKRGAI